MKSAYLVGILIMLLSCKEKSKIDCVEGDCLNGYGKFIYNDGIIYEGYFKDGKRHGRGKIYSPRGTYYEGDWKDHKPNGMGIKRWRDDCKNRQDETYVGSWKNGKMDGYGTYVDSNGNATTGQWKNNQLIKKSADSIAISDAIMKK
jgi:hypothetical protein